MNDLEIAKRRLKTMLTYSGGSALIAIVAMTAALRLHQDWLMGVFGLAVIVGFGAQIWFILGLRRTKTGA